MEYVERSFNTSGRVADEPAILVLMVKGGPNGLRDTDVYLNDLSIGGMFRYYHTAADQWRTVMALIPPGVLADGTSVLRSYRCAECSGECADYYVRNVVCFFKRASHAEYADHGHQARERGR
jgi:hypothetical protein